MYDLNFHPIKVFENLLCRIVISFEQFNVWELHFQAQLIFDQRMTPNACKVTKYRNTRKQSGLFD